MTTSPKSLRVGVVLAGQLVEECTFDGAAPVTFGQSLRCMLSIPVEGVPREHVLFTREAGRFVLHETKAMSVKRAGTRGKLTIGDATILFQEIATPPATPRPQLPAAIRGTFADRIDRRLALFVGGSLAVHIAIAAWAWTTDIETTPLGYAHVATTYQDEIVVTVPDEVPAPPTTNEPGVATPVAPRQTAKPIVRPTNIQRPASGDDAQRLATILTGDAPDENGTGSMGPRQPGADLHKQIDDARNRKVTIGDGTQTSRTDDRTNVDLDRDQIVDNQNITRTDRPDERPATGRISIGPVKPDDSTTLTPAVVLDRINTVYMAGLQRCYRVHGLNFDSKLSGRVAISFTVDERGQIIDPDASGVSSGVDGCIQKQMGGWRFPIPKDKDGDPTEASFAVSLALQPS